MDSTIDVSTPMASMKGSLFAEMERGLLRTEADIVYRFGSRSRERLSFTARMKNTKTSNSYRSVTNRYVVFDLVVFTNLLIIH